MISSRRIREKRPVIPVYNATITLEDEFPDILILLEQPCTRHPRRKGLRTKRSDLALQIFGQSAANHELEEMRL